MKRKEAGSAGSKFSELRRKAKKASERAYSPYSQAKVGSALLTESGKIFSGCNIENSSFGNTICAERVAIFKAVSQGEKKIKKIYVYTKDGWPPCGSCRQVMTEFASENLQIIIGRENGKESVHTLENLLPLAFDQKHFEGGGP